MDNIGAQNKSMLLRLKNYFKNDPLIIIITIFFIIFTIYWSNISILKFYALNATVWDLGLAMQTAYTFMHHPLQFYGNLILWVIFPVFIPQNFPLILAFQAAFITAGIFPIYGIAKHYLKLNSAAMLIAISYLFYPYLSGMYWFDFHYQALFPTLFLIGYYLFIKTRYKSAFILLILAGLTRYPYIFFIILLSFIIMLESLYNMKFKKPQFNINTMRFATILFLVALIIFILSYIASTRTATILQSMTAQAHFKGATFYSNIDRKLFVLYILFIPLFGLPLFSRRFALMQVPFIIVLFFANFGPYLFPDFVHFQYVPFLYLGAIDSIARIFEHHENSDTKLFKKFKNLIMEQRFKVAATILVVTVLFALVYNPYGPLNQYSMTNFDVAENTAVNWTTFNNLEHIVNMIPKNDPYVLTQNNIPEIYPRPLLYENTPITTFPYFFTNITVDTHYMRVASGHIYNVRIDYVLADIESPWYWVESHESMYNFTKLFYGSGEYGILAEAYPIVLLERDYTGPILYYVPFSEYFPYNEFILGSLTKTNNNYLYAQNISNYVPVWYGPYIYLGPGKYNITFQLETSNNSLSNTLKLDVSANSGQTILASQKINGSNFTVENKWTNITLSINVSNFIQKVEFRGFSSHWNGTIALKGVYVKQVAPSSRSQEFVELKKMMSLIPNNSTVIAENNLPDPIPELLTRYQIIQSDQINITMPQYAIASYPSWWITKFYGSGDYGILSEVSGIYLLEKNYTGPILYYVPFSEYFPYNEFILGSLTKTNNNYLYAQNISNYV
ncbi:MAG: DUF2079 domain-containing protein, partial [Candidatus Rehaiarchaeum fermentans]|nr:DUF2079 domain-containing protein [Candidatus Rehaiarchaeum fermentans]